MIEYETKANKILNKNTRPPTLAKVTTQPEALTLNKYLGFHQLSYLENNGFSCVVPIEIDNYYKNVLTDSPPDKLWTIRVASITGYDFDLPSIVGINANVALEWIKEQHKNVNYAFFCSKYFTPQISGRILIDYFTTKIEMSNGTFQLFKHNVPEISIESFLGSNFTFKNNTDKIKTEIIQETIELSKKLKLFYKNEFLSRPNLIYEYDFAFILEENSIKLKIIGMRSYDDKALERINNMPKSMLYMLSELFRDEAFHS